MRFLAGKTFHEEIPRSTRIDTNSMREDIFGHAGKLEWKRVIL